MIDCAPALCRVGSLTRPDLYLLSGCPGDGAPGRGPEHEKAPPAPGGAWPASILAGRVVDLHVGARRSGNDGIRFFFPTLGFALNLGHGSLVVAGLGVGSVGTCHALFGHSITSIIVSKTAS